MGRGAKSKGFERRHYRVQAVLRGDRRIANWHNAMSLGGIGRDQAGRARIEAVGNIIPDV